MKMQFDYFQYKLPDKPSDYYIIRATDTLKELKKQFPEQFKKNFRCPSEVLTISGVRSFDTYYEFGEDVPLEQVAEIKKFFKEKDMLVVEETFEAGGQSNKEHRYSLVHLPALKEIPERYGTVPGWESFDATKMKQEMDFFLWWLAWKDNIGHVMQNDKDAPDFSSNGVVSWWTGDYVCFGMLLGYPGEAICSALWKEAEMLLSTGKLDSGTVDADIKHSQDHDGAWPVYSYAKELADNPNIFAHQKLWSDILTGVYKNL